MQPNQLPLKDLHLPETITWFPPAIGWWIVAGLIVLIVIGCYFLYRRLTHKTALTLAKQQLLNIKTSSADNQQKLLALSALLRRVAMTVTSRKETASLTGSAWLAFLDNSMTGKPFSNGLGRCLIDTPYRPVTPSEQDISQLISLCENWLAQQKS